MLLKVAFSDHIPSTISALCAKENIFFNIFNIIAQKYEGDPQDSSQT